MQLAEAGPFIEFERSSRRRLGDLNLTPLIDILFILIIFFMLTTSFMRMESMELVLPSAAGKAASSDDMVHIFVYANGNVALGQRHVDQEELTESLSRMFSGDSNTKVMLLTADGVTMQQLVSIMDKIHMAGGKSLLVRKWETAPEAAKKPAVAKIIDVPVPVVKREAKPRKVERGVYGKADIRDLYGE